MAELWPLGQGNLITATRLVSILKICVLLDRDFLYLSENSQEMTFHLKFAWTHGMAFVALPV